MRIRRALLFTLTAAFSSASFPPFYAADSASTHAPLSRPERKVGGGIVWRRQDYKDFVTKAMHKPAFIRRELELSREELLRAEKLLQSGVVRDLLIENSQNAGTLFSVEKYSRHALIAGDAEFVVCLQTMLEDRMTFLLATSGELSGNVLTVLSLVDPPFLEAKPTLASEIAEDSYEGVRRILKPESEDYRRAGKRLRFYEDLATITILDRPDRIEQVRQYLALRPYAPRPKTY